MSIAMRQKIEREIIDRFVQDALAAGYRLAVSLERGYDIDEMLLGSRNRKEIVDAAMEGDEAHIFVQLATGDTVEVGDDPNDKAVVSFGWVYVVLGNDGWDVISDYTTNLEELLKGANELADKYSN